MSNRDCKYRDRLVALAENPLGPEATPDLLGHIETCPGCAAEYRWLKGLCNELEAYGDVMVKDAATIDITDSVMKALARNKQARPNLVVLQPARQSFYKRLAYIGATAAAAAGVVLTVWISGYQATRPYDQAALQPGKTGSNTAATRPLEQTIDPLEKVVAENRPYDAPPPDVSNEKLASLTLNDIIAARKEAVNEPSAKLRLTQWAELSAEKASAVAGDSKSSLDAKIGAINSLPPEEAERVLLAAIKEKPDDPYLRYALGNLYSQQPDMMEKAAAEYEAQAQLDPENALSYYQLASNMLGQGESAGAAEALETALSLAGAHPYTAEAANYNEQALEQSGLAKDVAQILTALSAGSSEYAQLVALGSELLDYGKYYEQSGNMQLAQQLYESVATLGSQIVQVASFANEQLAGLDIQRDAIETLTQFDSYTANPDNLQQLTSQSQQINQGLNSIGSFFSSLNDFFDRQATPDSMRAFAQYVLGNGDLGVVDFLNNR